MASSTRILIESRMQDALEGDPGACFDLGIAHSCGARAETDLIEAHKWFDLAARGGYASAETFRADIARALSRRQVAEAKRRSWLASRPHVRQAARFSASAFA